METGVQEEELKTVFTCRLEYQPLVQGNQGSKVCMLEATTLMSTTSS